MGFAQVTIYHVMSELSEEEKRKLPEASAYVGCRSSRLNLN
jgi:hypothetical protein